MSIWYRTGTVAVTNGSPTVTGTSTLWVSNVKIGDAMHLPDGRIYEVQNVTSDTSITLKTNYLGTSASGQSYAVQPTRGILRDVYDKLTTVLSSFQGYIDGALSGRFGNGTASAPSVTFSSNLNTGLFRPANNVLGLSAGGGERLRLTTAGAQLTGLLTGSAVVANQTDTTTGRLPVTGWMGVGGLPPLIGDASVTDNSLAPGCTYRYDSSLSSTGGPALSGTVRGFLLHFRRLVGGGEVQVFVLEAHGILPSGGVFTRSRATGAWSEWSMAYNQHNLLGTVRQSGGVPTGAVLEEGSNANGYFIRYASGKQECWHIIDDAAPAWDTASGSMFIRGSGLSWTFPAAFSVTPPFVNGSVLFGGVRALGVTVTNTSATTAIVRPYISQSVTAATAKSVMLHAIGRWF